MHKRIRGQRKHVTPVRMLLIDYSDRFCGQLESKEEQDAVAQLEGEVCGRPRLIRCLVLSADIGGRSAAGRGAKPQNNAGPLAALL